MVVDVTAAAAGAPGALALVTPEGRWTFEELAATVDARARALRAEGLEGRPVEPGTVAPVVLEADADGIVTLLALWKLGVVVAPLHPRLTAPERAAAVEGLGVAPPEAQVIVWTSGTGGTPRGVALSFDNLAASARAAAARLGLGKLDVWLASLSPAHVGGLALVTRSLLLGGTLVAAGAFDAERTSALADGRGPGGTESIRISHLSLVPTQLSRLLEARAGASPPDSFRCALVGGAHAPPELVARALRAGWPLALTYGATEMCSQIATAPPALTARKPGTVGAPLPGVELRVDESDQILVRGPTRAVAYVGRGGVSDPSDSGGWYHTGDLGRLDAEGHLWVTGRRQDRIVSGGVTVDAIEVEDALRDHPAVLDACVVGAADPEWGERVAAWIEPVVGEFDREDVEGWLRERLSAPKMPRVWHVAPGLPRNANGKIDRASVRRTLDRA